MTEVAVIGGGAAGCFAAVEIARNCPGCNVTVYESGRKLMTKLALTGGGRCNITNDFKGIINLKDAYPRGERLMKRALSRFGNRECLEWFEREGVRFVTQDDHCVFPESQDAMQIVRTLESAMRRSGVKVECLSKVEAVREGFVLHLGHCEKKADMVLVTTGGGAVGMLEPLNVKIEPTVPSLFTFRIKDSSLNSLMGTVAPNVILRIAGTSFRSDGILLVTDWGISGPATLRLSSYAARHLALNNYRSKVVINWTGMSEDECRKWMSDSCCSDKILLNLHPEGVSERLWNHLLGRASLRSDGRWKGLGKAGVNKLVSVLTGDEYEISGRAAFKEEFVTCGGVSLEEINYSTMASKRIEGLFFAGEVLDIDAITGGFNLQAAWSTAYCAAGGIRQLCNTADRCQSPDLERL